MMCQAHVRGRLGGKHQLLDRPRLPRGSVAANCLGSESVKSIVVSWMDCDELPLQMRRKLRDLNANLCDDTAHFVAVRLALGGALQVEETAIPSWDLHALVSKLRRPAAYVPQIVEWCTIARKLREKN